MALLRWLHRKIWPQKPKIAPKKSVFWVNWPKNNIWRSGYPNFFFYFANIRCLEVPKKISGHISKKWLRYDHLKRRGKNGKRRKWSFSPFFNFTTSLQMVISQSVLGNMTWNFFWNLQTSYISKREKKNWGTLTFKYCFQVNKLKNPILLERFLVLVAKFSYEVI